MISVRYGLFFFLFILFSACLDEPDCLLNATNLVKIDFKNTNGTEKTVTLTKATVSGVTTTFYANQAVKSVQLPVDPLADQTTFTFTYGTTTSTLILSYSKTTKIISTKCGAYVYYTDLAVAEHGFTTIKIKNPSLLINVTTNVEIYF